MDWTRAPLPQFCMLVCLNPGGLFQTFYLNPECLNSKCNEVQHALVEACCACDRGPNYFEVDIDVGSSKSAASVVGLVQGALKGLVIDMGITMEGHSKVAMPLAAFPTAQLVQSKSLTLQNTLLDLITAASWI